MSSYQANDNSGHALFHTRKSTWDLWCAHKQYDGTFFLKFLPGLIQTPSKPNPVHPPRLIWTCLIYTPSWGISTHRGQLGSSTASLFHAAATPSREAGRYWSPLYPALTPHLVDLTTSALHRYLTRRPSPSKGYARSHKLLLGVPVVLAVSRWYTRDSEATLLGSTTFEFTVLRMYRGRIHAFWALTRAAWMRDAAHASILLGVNLIPVQVHTHWDADLSPMMIVYVVRTPVGASILVRRRRLVANPTGYWSTNSNRTTSTGTFEDGTEGTPVVRRVSFEDGADRRARAQYMACGLAQCRDRLFARAYEDRPFARPEFLRPGTRYTLHFGARSVDGRLRRPESLTISSGTNEGVDCQEAAVEHSTLFSKRPRPGRWSFDCGRLSRRGPAVIHFQTRCARSEAKHVIGDATKVVGRAVEMESVKHNRVRG
ncbi:hypothetical protein NEOLEDRAFT_1145356 [Neolentinus lepideus HHB14362 ss-1]|uniref:Uncharacterized protein n=1 Tax=Neolentinus lepideus HHB14362 ss-1 TaxID=1314782 RepID=A0A165V285_9AGAM|nr:hypothetical protein NEOLEDRAFT_1145356 [Neolentinus lepideus HHB14362 ss-1]